MMQSRTLGCLGLVLSLVACEDPPPEPETTKAAPPAASTAKVDVPPRPTTTRPAPPEPKQIPAPEDVAEAPKDAKKTASGLFTKVLTKGTGKDKPKLEDK